MRYKSTLLAQASGSVGGLTFSHNAGGMYIRNRSVPTDPATSAQSAVRGHMASLVNFWADVLSDAQREAWGVYAGNVALNDVFGDPRFRSGINHYVRSNIPRLQSGLPRVDDGPTTFNLGEYTQPTFGIDATADELDVTFDNTDDWANEDDAAMIVYGSRPMSPSINFFKGPFQYAANIDGDAVTPPTSPAALTSPFAFVAGQQGVIRVIVSRADGRLSAPFLDGVLAA